MTAQLAGSLPPTWRTQTERWTPGPAVAIIGIWEMNQETEDLFSAFQITKLKSFLVFFFFHGYRKLQLALE